MRHKNGAIVGATVAFLFYMFLTIISPTDGLSVLPTANVIGDPALKSAYLQNLPVSIIVFLSLELVGIILGVIGHRIISTTPKQGE
jgi:hypothetical protein